MDEAIQSLRSVLYAVLAVLAWAVAARDRGHAPLAAYITWMAVENVVREGIALLAGAFPAAIPALRGLDTCVTLSWSFLFLICIAHYFLGGRGIRGIVAAWGLTWVYLRLGDPALFNARYQLVQYLSLLASASAMLYAFRFRRGLSPGLAHLTLGLYLAADVVAAVVPMRRDLHGNWPVTRFGGVLVLGAQVAAHLWWLRKNLVGKR